MTLNTREVINCPDSAQAITNRVYLNPSDPLSSSKCLECEPFVYSLEPHAGVPPGCIALNAIQRKNLRVSTGDAVHAMPYVPSEETGALMVGELMYVSEKLKREAELDAARVSDRMVRCFQGQVFAVGQDVAFEFEGTKYKFHFSDILVARGGEQVKVGRAWMGKVTGVVFTNTGSQNPIKITNQRHMTTNQIFKPSSINFEELGIGGLGKQFGDIFRRAFASRVFPPSVIERLGIRHVKGMLLHGPPGTGKTLIARQIGKMLNGREPKVVNGPEVLNKYVGASEENIRNLFGDAEAEYKEKGEASELHIIIFDEIDAICKQRGSVRDGSGVHDTIVNQLLTKVDGVDSLNNILLIGMTNRKDLLDEALLRPGRLEVHVEIGLPDQAGRHEILRIHTTKMSKNSFLDKSVDLLQLAELTKNFSGAEIEGLVGSAVSFALNRHLDMTNLSKTIDDENVKVTMSDFEAALEEVKPAFGAQRETLESYCTGGMISSGPVFDHLLSTCHRLVNQVRSSENTPLLTCLLEGPAGSGKTALAAQLGILSEYPFVKVASAENMVGYSEHSKCLEITKIFADAHKSSLSLVILDDVERLLEYVAIGPRFSNLVLQTLLVLLKKRPPEGRKLLVCATSSSGDVLDTMGLSDVFNVVLNVPPLTLTEEIETVIQSLDVFSRADIPKAVELLGAGAMPIKRLLMLVEMARQTGDSGATRISLRDWQGVLEDLGTLP
ncbi:unnamed protein product [Ostreobium quekettii]|uniref:Vesicle-fusing ATPase n=1 Tax=Ostreobium quekettii TaxID=121088 RepID=A0A8S1IWJ6_9CHLO|nr:unnamed protein product [Ostreobium quekettii]|eukprot:evm.model.scf_1107EXC.4 EVM.evm.TU.scf_1107EXC.4   scf_1107EXC:39870-42044(-)